MFICFPQVVPTDEVVTLKMFHREDEPLIRLFLDDEQTRTLDRLWVEQRFVSRQPVAEWDYLPQFMGFTTQDTPKAFQQFFIDRKPLFKKHAAEFEAEEAAAIPKQLDALFAFAEKAYRRPLLEKERAELLALYKTVRAKGAAHDEAFRGVISRVLVSPAFLFRIEQTPAGKEAGPVNDWELATRLSYFLWSSPPDAERAPGRGSTPRPEGLGADSADAEGQPHALTGDRVRHAVDSRSRVRRVEGERQNRSQRSTRTRKAIYEESILFFQDLFQSDRGDADSRRGPRSQRQLAGTTAFRA